jgi:iron complex outermembrane receptor protein
VGRVQAKSGDAAAAGGLRSGALWKSNGARRVHRRKLAGPLAGLVLGLVVFPGSVRGDERTEARSHFKKGMAEIADGRYELGIEELKKAYEILPHPNVLYNIGRAYADQGDLENAVVYYRRYLEGNPKDRDEVAQIVASLEARIRRQQSELLEAQRAQPGAVDAEARAPASGGTSAGADAGAPVGPGSPAAPTGGPAATGSARPGLPERPGRLPDVRMKTEDVFEETVVTASKTAQSPLDAPNSTSIITAQDIRLSGITKIPELLRRLAGIDIMEMTGAQTEVSLRGFNQRFSNKVIVLVDGRSVFIDFIGVTLWAVLSIGVEDIERIEVVRGPGSALYGADAFNGVINIITKAPGEGGSGFNVGYGDRNTTHGTMYASGRSKNASFRVSAGYDYLPRWSREVPARRVDLQLATGDEDASQRTVRLDGNVAYQLTPDVTARLQTGYTEGTTEVFAVGVLNDLVAGPFENGDVMASLSSKQVDLRVYGSQTRTYYAVNAAYIGDNLSPSRVVDSVADAEAQYKAHFGSGRLRDDLQLGVDFRYKGIQWTGEPRDETEGHASFFAHDELRVGRFVALVGDYRADYVPYLQRIVQSPRGSILIHPSQKSTIRAIVGTAFRTPTFLEAYFSQMLQLPLTAAAVLAEGQPSVNPGFKLRPESIFTTELGYLNSESDYFTFDGAAFYSRASDLIDLAPTRPLTVGDLAGRGAAASSDPQTGLYPAYLFSGVDGSGVFENECQFFDVYGAELGLRVFPAEGLDLYANSTLMDVRQDNSRCSDAQLALLANDARTSAVKVNTGVQLRTKFGIDGSVDFHYVSPQEWAEQVVDFQRQREEYQPFHLDPYSLLNASVGYRFPGTQAEIRGVGFNLLDQRHREHPFGQVIDRRLMAFLAYRF